MSYFLFAIPAIPWRPIWPLDASHIKTKFSYCCRNTSALVAYLQVTMSEAVLKGKCVRDIDPADKASRGLTANKFLLQRSWLIGPEFPNTSGQCRQKHPVAFLMKTLRSNQ